MNGKTLASIIGAMLLAAVIGWRLAFSEAGKTKPPFGASAPPAAATGSTASLSSPPANGPQPAPAVWAAPTGDPLQRYHAAKTTEEKMQVISDFITLGHDHNVFMLQEAVRDASPKVRMLALESAASMLTPELASEVYRFSGRSDDPDIRAMTWSFLAPHPMENRVAVYGDVFVAGQDTALEEALAEMG
ncbi:MAG: hypothetical protein JWO94_1563, partial [Verrucomicrobiaceae bacterium]|nr:hypothetical protein [Verrucomicrobiaceae bacterium]